MQLTRFWIIGLLFLAVGAGGQTPPGTNRVVRTLALEECIREALEHNLSIQIERHNPNVSRYRLAASYGLYDPVYTAQYTRSYNSTEGRFNPNTGVVSFSSTADSDFVFNGFSGVLPTGMRYDLGLDFAHSRGSRGGSGNDFDDYTALADISLSQPLLKNFWIDASRLQIKLNKLNVKTSEYNYETTIRNVVLKVQIAYYELIFAQEDVKVQEKAVELANALVAQNREKVRVGTLAPLDEKQAESQAAVDSANLILAQHRLLVAENVLKNLITDSYGAWINTAVAPSEKLLAMPEVLNLQESWSTAFTKRPDYLAVVLEAEKQGLVVKYNQNQLYPELNLVGGYGRNGLDSSFGRTVNTNSGFPVIVPPHDATLGNALGDIREGNNPTWNAGALFRLPLSLKFERNRYSEAKEVKQQIDVQIRKLFQDIQNDVDNWIIAAKGTYGKASASKQARIYAEDALAAEQTKLENGKSTSFNVLQLQRDLTTRRGEEIRVLADYNESLANLYYSDGTILDRAKIMLQR